MLRRLVTAALAAAVSLPAPARGAPPAAAPSFDCSRARAADEKVVCASPDLSALDGRMGETYAAALAGATPAAREKLRGEHSQWLRLRSACAGAGPVAKDDLSAAATCMRPLYARRLAELLDHAPAPPEGVGARSLKWTDEKRHVQVSIAYPALAPGTPGARAFDAFFLRQARRWEARAREIAADPRVSEAAKAGGMPSVVDASFEIVLGTRRIVTVVSSGYECATGGDPLRFRTATTFDLVLGRPLGEADVFAPGGKKRAVALAVERLGAPADGAPEKRPASATKAAGDLSNWAFGADRVEVTFPAHAVGPFAKGESRVELDYGELRPFLRRDAAVLSR